MKQRGGNCALINRETFPFDGGKLLPARNPAYSVKCLSRIFQVHGMHDINDVTFEGVAKFIYIYNSIEKEI